ncbi:MAG: hypothetical protein A2046_16195 [Bacteroidetes bacterium GWA2_30_7]|nr:MAG: hypothetical protein A2046_16195 [Bacteroidetes bacterium GWA2_30_7]
MNSKAIINLILIFFLIISLFSCTNKASDNKTHADIIIKNALILTQDSTKRIIENGVIVILNSKIVEIGNNDLTEKYSAKEIIDATDKLVMPGLINTHTHAAMTILRGVADDLPLLEWLYKHIFPLEAKYVNAENVTLGTQLAVLEMIHSGTTTFNDMYFYEDEVAQVCKSIGMRAVLTESLIDFPVPNSKTPQDGLKYSENLINKYLNDSLITIGIAAHSPYTCSPWLLQESKKLADKYNVPYNIHLSETKWEVDTIQKTYNLTPVGYLDSLKVLSENVIGAHCVHLSDSDIQTIANKGVGVAHNPQCNLKISSGVAPIPELLKAHAQVGLGTDGVVSNNDLNMFEEMNTAAIIHKYTHNEPTVMNATEVVDIATIGGAKALGLDKKIGSLEVGKLADLIIIDLNKPHLIPLYNIYSQIVYSVDGSDVETVIINGKIIMKENKIITIDEKEVLSKFKEFAENLKKNLNEQKTDYNQ